jgi:adenosylhomocysteine nucleosidase
MTLKILKIAFLLIFLNVAVFAQKAKYAVIISANMEWKVIKKIFPNEKYQKSVWGEFFYKKIKKQNILFFHEGWGKVAAAGSTQYVIDTYKPKILINLGTCGGFEGKIQKLEVILVDKTIIYDIVEAMGDSKEAIADYTTNIDLMWLNEYYPVKVKKTTLVSADKDLAINEIEKLQKEYNAVAGDWESGAIAYVANKNKTKLLILRGVSDLVSSNKGEAYGNFDFFAQQAEKVMINLIDDLPKWIEHIEKYK